MKLSGGLILLSYLVVESMQDKVDSNAKAVVVENDSSVDSKKVEPKLLSANPAINSAVVGVGVGVLGSLLVGALLDNKNKCNNRYSRDTAAQTRFLPGVFGSKCPPRQNGYNPAYNNNGYRQPGNVYPRPPAPGYNNVPYPQRPVVNRPINNHGYQPVNTGYQPVNAGYQPVNTGYQPVNTGYQPVNTGYQPVNTGYQAVNSGYRPVNTGYQPANVGYQQANVYQQGAHAFPGGVKHVNSGGLQSTNNPAPPGSFGSLAQFGRSSSGGSSRKTSTKTDSSAPEVKKSSAVNFGK